MKEGSVDKYILDLIENLKIQDINIIVQTIIHETSKEVSSLKNNIFILQKLYPESFTNEYGDNLNETISRLNLIISNIIIKILLPKIQKDENIDNINHEK